MSRLVFFTKEKLLRRLDEIALYRYEKKCPMTIFQTAEDIAGEISARPENVIYDSELEIGAKWTGRDRYLWLKTAVTFPEVKENTRLIGYFDFGNTGDGHNSGFESLLFVDGKPFQGVDQNHREVLFPDSFAGTTTELTFRLWSGLEGGGAQTVQTHQLKEAFIGYLNLAIDDLYFTSKAALKTLDELEERNPSYASLLQAVNRAYLAIDWSVSGSKKNIASMETANQILQSAVTDLPKNFPVKVSAIGHTHIDVAWLWRLKHTREKAARSFSTVLHLMEDYPEYLFLQSQPQLYAYIKEDYPEIYEKMKAKIKDGTWEADGGMWLEADCNIPSGESLVRQMLYGQKFLREEFGKPSSFLWLPDVFGYSWALPQILRKSGIKTFMTTKISWNQYNQMPHDTFQWRGIDGTEILTHFITAPEKNSHISTYNGKMTARELAGLWTKYQDKDINQELLLAYGYGDGGGGVNREMLEMRRRYDKMPGIPEVQPKSATDYFHDLHETIEKTDQYVHTWNGELYFEYHRGTYTSQAFTKKMNRKLELGLRDSEWLSVLAYLKQGAPYPRGKLAGIWQILLRNQFHDIIPGSSIKEVYDDALIEYTEAMTGNTALITEQLRNLTTPESEKITLWNSSTWSRPRYIEVALENTEESFAFYDETNVPLPTQKLTTGKWLIQHANLPALGAASISTVKTTTILEKSSFDYTEKQLETPFYQVTWNEQGQFTSIFDKKNNRQVLAENALGNVFQLFEDKPMWHDAWDIDLFYQEKQTEITNLSSFEIVENGLLLLTVKQILRSEKSQITQLIHFYHDSPEIRFETEVDWQDRNQLLKVAFPVSVHASEASYDIQFGNVKRPTHWNTSWDYARFETVGHQWADLSEKNYGVSLLNESKYGYDIKDSTIRLTLLKAAGYPDPQADLGIQSFTYSLYPHSGDFLDAKTVQTAWELNNPIFTSNGAVVSFSLFQITNPYVVIDSIKQAENGNGLIVRLHEFASTRGEVTLTSDYTITAISECNLLEEEEEAGVSTTFQITPFEIKTFRIHLA
ncbi:alpha-mannosidase [Listeria ivanovii]|uniref:alpha-mannosidase n=1 Tax=Listeria ivanovii TaxID=1638 RepID=UPI0030CFB428